jgi:hypothetical protein
VIQLAAAFLTLPTESETSGIMAVLIGIGLMLTLIKTQSIVYQLMFYNTGRAVIKKFSGQVINVLQARQTEEAITAKSRLKLKER